MVALEAMERARPVIASAVGGLPEIVADGETRPRRALGGRRGAGRSDRRARGRPLACRRDGARRPHPSARRVHAGAVRRADRGALRARARACLRVVPARRPPAAPGSRRSPPRPGSRRGSPTARGSASRRRRASRRTSGSRAAGARARGSVAGTTKSPTIASTYSAIMKAGSTTLRAVSRQVPAPGLPSVSSTFGCHSKRVAWPASRSFSPGCSRQNSTTFSRKKRICSHSSTSTIRPVSRQIAPASWGLGGAPGYGGTSSIHPPRASTSYVFEVVRLPQRPRVGRHREAADGSAVAHDPRRQHECRA